MTRHFQQPFLRFGLYDFDPITLQLLNLTPKPICFPLVILLGCLSSSFVLASQGYYVDETFLTAQPPLPPALHPVWESTNIPPHNLVLAVDTDHSAHLNHTQSIGHDVRSMSASTTSLLPVEQQQSDGHHGHHVMTNAAESVVSTDQAASSGATSTPHNHHQHGNKVPTTVRSADYSEGYDNVAVHHMHTGPNWGVHVKSFDIGKPFRTPEDEDEFVTEFDIESWYGTQQNKLMLRLQGALIDKKLDEGLLRVTWRRPISAFWDVEIGGERTRLDKNYKNWFVASVNGTLPYWPELEAIFKVDADGQTALGLDLDYEWRLTRSWRLEPQVGYEQHFRLQPQSTLPRQILLAGARLGYKVNPQLYPYVGAKAAKSWFKKTQLDVPTRQTDYAWMAGLDFWF